MVSSSSRKSNSSASKQKPTFRRAGTTASNPSVRKDPARPAASSGKKPAVKKKASGPVSVSVRPSQSRAKATRRSPSRKQAAPSVVRPVSQPRKAAPRRAPMKTSKAALSAPVQPVRATGAVRAVSSALNTEKMGAAVQAAAARVPRVAAPAFVKRVAIAAGAVIAVLVLVAVIVLNTGVFAATDIVIKGSEHVPESAAQSLISLPEGTTLFNVDEQNIIDSLKQNPWVNGVEVERRFPHTLVITPKERTVAALAYITADDVAWAIGSDKMWIAPVSLAVTVDEQGKVISEGARAPHQQPPADGDANAPNDGASRSDSGNGESGTRDSSQSDASVQGDVSADPSQGGQDGAGGTQLSGLDAALAVAKDLGCPLLTDVGTDVAPQTVRPVKSRAVLAGLAYVEGFSQEFLAQVKDISVASVEAVSANLSSGVEVSLGAPNDIQTKERVVTKLLAEQQGVTYINVRVPDAYAFRSVPRNE